MATIKQSWWAAAWEAGDISEQGFSTFPGPLEEGPVWRSKNMSLFHVAIHFVRDLEPAPSFFKVIVLLAQRCHLGVEESFALSWL